MPTNFSDDIWLRKDVTAGDSKCGQMSTATNHRVVGNVIDKTSFSVPK